MTKDQVIELAKQAGIQGCYSQEVVVAFHHFAQLVRNAALEEAAKKCEDEDVAPTDCPLGVQSCIAQAIRAMKETI
jgi:hypothetical protein